MCWASSRAGWRERERRSWLALRRLRWGRMRYRHSKVNRASRRRRGIRPVPKHAFRFFDSYSRKAVVVPGRRRGIVRSDRGLTSRLGWWIPRRSAPRDDRWAPLLGDDSDAKKGQALSRLPFFVVTRTSDQLPSKFGFVCRSAGGIGKQRSCFVRCDCGPTVSSGSSAPGVLAAAQR